ncbi:MAG TPA: hypothetical protein VIR57_00125 [Chloroflexota bacterium]|jgi:hypothetical protein
MTAVIPQADLVAMRARAEAATPGPWQLRLIGEQRWTVNYYEHGFSFRLAEIHGFEDHQADADFIAAARTDVPRLLDAYEELRTLSRELAAEVEAEYAPLALLAKARAAGLLEREA